MSVEICAVVDRIGMDLAPARAVGDGPYVVVADATEAGVAERIASRVAVLRALQGTACLPFRLGSAVDDDAAAGEWLSRHRPAVEAALARAAGRAEFDLHLVPAPDTPLGPAGDGPGTRHLRQLAARYAALSEERAGRVLAACDALPGVVETAVVAEGGFIAFLVSDVTAFADAVRSLPLAGARWSGPWPAFTFAERWLADA